MSRDCCLSPRTALALAALLAALAWTLLPGNVEAHATLVRSDPPVNARLIDPPSAVTAFFSEPLDSRLSSMQVVDGSGERVDTGEMTFGPDPGQMSVAVKDLKPTFYAVQWETLSNVDGHLLKGSIPFTVLNPDGTEPSGPRPLSQVSDDFSLSYAKPGDVATKWINLLGAVLVVGSLGFALGVAGPASRGLSSPLAEEAFAARRRHLAWAVWPGVALLGATAVSEALLQANRLGGFEYLDEALRTGWGDHWIERQVLLGAMAAAFAFFQLRGFSIRIVGEALLWGMLGGGVLYLMVVAQVSHGASIPGSFWATAADFAHLLGAAVWVGMLAQLGLLLAWVRRQPHSEERDALLLGHLRRFSPFAATSVVVLLASGSANALSQLPDLESIVDTVYGQVLLVKLGLIAALLLIAGVNAFYLRPRLTSGRAAGEGMEGPAERRNLLWRTVRLEIGMAILVLLVTAALVQYPTSRQQRSAEENVETANEAAGFNAVQTAGDIDIQLGISPNQVGTNSYLIYVFPPSTGEPAEVLRVRLRFESPDPEIGPALINTEPTERNSYKAIGPFFNAPGGWTVSVEVRRAEVDDITAAFDVDVTGIGAVDEGDDFAFPLQAGSWGVVAGASVILLAIVVLVWVTQWPSRQPGRPSASRGKQPL